MELNPVLNDVLMSAFNEAKDKKHEYLTPEHILYAALNFDEGRRIIEGSGGDVKSLKNNIEDFFDKKMDRVDVDEPRQSVAFQNVMERAIWHTASAQKNTLDLGDVLVSIIDEEESFAAYFLGLEGISRYELLKFISHGVSVYPEESGDEDYTEGEPEPEQIGRAHV